MPRVRRRRLAGGGVVKLPKGEVGRVATALVKQFQPCRSEYADPGETYVTPPPDYIPVCTFTRKPKSHVCAVPVHDVGWMAKGRLVVGGHYRPSDKSIWLRVEEDQCAPRKHWAQRLRETLRHELTHAADPYVRVRRTPYARAESAKDFCKYIRDPVEVAANLAQVRQELLHAKRTIRKKVYRGSITRPEHVLHESPKYEDIVQCFTPKIQRRFLQMAARLWSSGELGPLPRQYR